VKKYRFKCKDCEHIALVCEHEMNKLASDRGAARAEGRQQGMREAAKHLRSLVNPEHDSCACCIGMRDAATEVEALLGKAEKEQAK
jgi:hypothetical protein